MCSLLLQLHLTRANVRQFSKSILPDPDAIFNWMTCLSTLYRVFTTPVSLAGIGNADSPKSSGPRCTIIYVVEKDLGVSAQVRNYFKLGRLVH